MRIHPVGFLSTALACSLFALGAVAQDADLGWDANGDGVGLDEWNEGFADAGIFDDWDADDDGLLSEDEFTEGVFGTYDEDEDGILGDNELQVFQDDVGDDGFWDL